VIGLPLWLTALLMVLSAAAAHLLTMQRETRKARRDWIGSWEKIAEDQAKKILDAAIRHYLSEDGVKNTSVSSVVIISDFRRLQAMIAETVSIRTEDSAAVQKAYVEFHGFVTDANDFQDPARLIRDSSDPIVSRMLDAEQDLLKKIKGKRKRK